MIDNYIRGLGVREITGHSLSCYTPSSTFSWFNESKYYYDNIYMTKANLLIVTDTFLTRLIMKIWLTCALEADCLLALSTESSCSANKFDIRSFEHSALVIILTHFFYPNKHLTLNEQLFRAPAPYDIFSSMHVNMSNIEHDINEKNRLFSNRD